MNDRDQGDTYMRVTDGSVSAAFQQLRLPMGAGLGGLVAQTATPYVTPSYFEDERFRHTGSIDGAVTEEGLVSILGVPLLLGSAVIGVLYAANRTERPFTREDTALLVSMAAHAAIAIDSARLLGETRDAVRELSSTSALLREHNESVERAAGAHDLLTELVLRGGDVADVASAVTEVLGGRLLVFDADGRCLTCAGTGGDGVADADRAEVRLAVESASASGRSASAAGVWAVPVLAGSEPLGSLALLEHEDLTEADRRILERSALVTALLLLFQRSTAEAEGRVRGELVGDLLRRPAGDAHRLRESARRLDADLDRPHVVVVARVDDIAPRRLEFAAAQYAAARQGLAGLRDDVAVLVLPGSDPSGAAREAAGELSAAVGRPVTAGGAGPVEGPEGVRGAYDDAERCLDALRALGRDGDAASTVDLGFVGLLLADRQDVSGFVDSALGPVVEYDERRGTDLVGTLEAYFKTGGNLGRTKDLLHVHVNTVTQRLDRVSQLLGKEWSDPGRVLEVPLALRLLRLRAKA